MKISIGADHKGYAYKEMVKAILEHKGYFINDRGAFSEESSDYPDYALSVGKDVISEIADYGILICWTGIGMAMAANKIKGIRAGLALDTEMAELARSHNDANVLVLAAKYTPLESLGEIVDKFLTTAFEGGRHQRRLDKIKKYEDDTHVR
jgi:ribose 5-phosphate isomerase B